ncbi:MAG: ABC-2 family transporter protein [Nanoarchaeota archaeon]|nr:ABC-2 family transporter protein [Nanoarchaeota archaeon]
MIKKSYAIARAGFKEAVAYRFHFYVTLVTSPLTLLIYYFLWKSIFEYSNVDIIRGFTFEGIVAYYALNMIVGFFVWSNVDEWLENDVRYGNLVNNLLKPFNFIFFYFFNLLGVSSLSIFLEMVPFFLIAIFLFGVKVAPVFYFLMFIVSIVLALLMSFLISYFVGMSAFWFKNISGIRRVKRVLIVFLSGGMIPLTFFPEVVQGIFKYLPFQYIRSVPINIYLGSYTYLETLMLIGIQVFWIFVLYLIVNGIWNRAFKKFAGAGI